MNPRENLAPSRRTLLKAAAGCAVATMLPRVSLAAAPTPPSADMVLWYDQPSMKWVEALPLGNSRIGAMVHGGVDEERIELNDNTLYSGEPGSRDLPQLN